MINQLLNEGLLAKYLTAKRLENHLTVEAIVATSEIPESTVKNLLSGKSKDPQLSTIIPVMEAVGGSFDEMLNVNKGEAKEGSVLALKDIYEYQLSVIKETNEEHIHNIRAHYEQHHEDLKENFEKRLSDKREIIDSCNKHIATLEKECRSSKIAFWICVAVFIAVLVAEVMHPSLGWVRY